MFVDTWHKTFVWNSNNIFNFIFNFGPAHFDDDVKMELKDGEEEAKEQETEPTHVEFSVS